MIARKGALAVLGIPTLPSMIRRMLLQVGVGQVAVTLSHSGAGVFGRPVDVDGPAHFEFQAVVRPLPIDRAMIVPYGFCQITSRLAATAAIWRLLAEGFVASDRSGDAFREVAAAAPFQPSKLYVERDCRALVSVVALAEGLAVGDVGPTASAVGVHMVGLQTFGGSAATEEPPVVFAPSARAEQDRRLVSPGEPPDWIFGTVVDHRSDEPNRTADNDQREDDSDPR